MSADVRTLTLTGVAIILLVLFKSELFDFETTIIAFLILIIFGFNAVIVILLRNEPLFC